MPKSPNGYNAPFTETYRDEWRKWWRVWGELYPHPVLVASYAELDRQKAKPDSFAQKVSKA